jgi:G:T-mismatch repair DNA endonuclease (very short patch repair protein)
MNPDFICDEEKKVIEVYGDYWHRNDNPQDRINKFKKMGSIA